MEEEKKKLLYGLRIALRNAKDTEAFYYDCEMVRKAYLTGIIAAAPGTLVRVHPTSYMRVDAIEAIQLFELEGKE